MNPSPLKLLALTLAMSGAEMTAHGTEGVDAKRRFHIKSVDGPVAMRFPFEAVWHRVVKGRSLPAGVMLAVGEHARIGFDYPKPGAMRDDDRILVSINAPIVARFDDDLIRRVKVTSQFLEQKAENTAPPPAGGVVSQLRETWEKFIAVARSEQTGPAAKAKDMEAHHKTGSIVILRPAPDGLVLAPSPTSGVRIVWQAVQAAGVEYSLKVWLADDSEPTMPTARTATTEYMVKPSRFGRYHASVASSDGEWQSPIITFDLAASTTGAAIAANGISAEVASTDLALTGPPDNFTVHDAKLPYYFDFAWVDHGGEASAATYQVIIKDANDVVRASMKTQRQSARIYIPVVGAYSWQVIGVGTGATPGSRRIKTSLRRFVALEGPNTPEHPVPTLDKRLAEFLAVPGRRVLQLESGL